MRSFRGRSGGRLPSHSCVPSLGPRRRRSCAPQRSAPAVQGRAARSDLISALTTMDGGMRDYGRWTKEALIRRIRQLEVDGEEEAGKAGPDCGAQPARGADGGGDEAAKAGLSPERAKKGGPRGIDPSRYTTRLVAFKLAYVGKNYAGFEYQTMGALSTVEEELWKAMVQACLIFPDRADEVRWEDWEYSKCGRTDRGVSAFGQVIAVRVRSNRPLPREAAAAAVADLQSSGTGQRIEERGGSRAAPPVAEGPAFDDHTDEIQYCRILNRLLPPDIRILAWCPTVPPGFSARHDCRERQYRYFFTQPAFSPMPRSLLAPKHGGENHVQDGWLDIDAMRRAARKFEGVHDFRNFCKIDPGKLLTHFDRRIFECDIVEVEDAATALPYISGPEMESNRPDGANGILPKVYYFHVRGSAFLWHQIRCMVAVLFQVGQGLEDASIIDNLLDVESQPQRPNYTMANEYPLVLWDCIFPKDGDPQRADSLLDWVYVGEENPLSKYSTSGLVDHLWGLWRERKLDEILSSQLLDLVSGQADTTKRLNSRAPPYASISQRTFEGGNRERVTGKHTPILAKQLQPTPEESYDKEAKRKGFADAQEWREARAKKREEYALVDAKAKQEEDGDG